MWLKAKYQKKKKCLYIKEISRKGFLPTGKSFFFFWLFLFALKKKSVLVAVKLTSGLYAPEEFWRLTLKKIKDLWHPFQNCLGKENKRRWGTDPVSTRRWELSKIRPDRKQFSIKSILHKFEHSLAHANNRPDQEACVRSALGEKQGRETALGLGLPTQGWTHCPGIILLPGDDPPPHAEYQNRE